MCLWKRGSFCIIVFFILFISFESTAQIPDKLKILTANIWTGLDYYGSFKMGEYEKTVHREERFNLLVQEIKKLAPDVIFLQEVNPVMGMTGRLADSLGFDEIHQVCLSGFKFFGMGIPSNLNEGISILARNGLHLTKTAVPKLSDDFSLCGDLFSLQFQESNYALIGSIEIQQQKIILLNTHLRYIVRMTNEVTAFLNSLSESSLVQKSDYNKVIGKIAGFRETAREEINKLAELIKDNYSDRPVIIGGDFNLEPDDELIQDFTLSQKLIDVLGENEPKNRISWDPVANENARLSTSFVSAGGDSLDLFGKTSAIYDMKPRRVDYILLNNKFIKEDILTADIVMNKAQKGKYVSDHYGVFTEIELNRVTAEKNNADLSAILKREKSFEMLPILSYDTDVGFGYGVKTFFLNYLQCKESFDILAFNSTKGERWYRFVFSLPDFELRQGTVYPWAFDIIADFDKYIKNNFFGTGEAASFSLREYYTKTPFEFSMNLSRGFTRNIVLQAGIKYRSVNISNFEPGSKFYSLPDPRSRGTVKYLALSLSFRFDSRDSYINPGYGSVIQLSSELAPKLGGSFLPYMNAGFWLQNYYTLFYPKTVLAVRFGMQSVFGNDLPVQLLLPLGGNQTLRGSVQDRYLTIMQAIANVELRFPIFWRFGGVLGVDAGKAFDSVSGFGLKNWNSNPAVGIRFYFDTFIVRADLGFGNETTGFYLNFGHVF